ncbi:phenylacetate--CoA ligase family protein [Nocardia stercoris]|uniref:Phenylacetate--CoA ligase family protein n=2 Tax=Nocardia stercoris TaxID=2483361 RepID=A0A3M2L2U4_9NOCA|nr:phenylacetate--CoA ligase family protein [Nocardia stercoris]
MTRWNDGQVTPEELVEWQTSALRTVLGHVYEKSPFYGRRLSGVDLDIEQLSDLARIPFTTKDDLRTELHDVLSGSIGEAAFYFETTGTTGRPTPCPRAPIDFELNWLPFAHALERVVEKHFPPGGERPVLAVIAPNDVHSACLSLSFAAQRAGITKLDLFPVSPTLGFARFFEVLAELKVNILYCSPGLLMALAEMSAAYGIEVPDDLHVKVLLTTGEMCTDNMRDLLAETWQCAAYNFNYGSQEAGTPALAWPDGSQVVLEPTYLLEVLDLETEQTLGFEGYGELCLTNLVPGLKPLIRYRTGDLVDIRTDAVGHRVIKVLGRVKDMTEIGGIKRGAAEIDNAILADPKLVYGYEIDIHATDGVDRLVVRIKAKEGVDHDRIKALVADRLTAAFGVAAEVRIHPLLDLKSTTGGWVSWKTARIKDLRAQVTDDIEVRSADDLARAVEKAI